MRARVVDSTVEQLLDALEELGDVDARRMFGGHGIFRDGTMFAIVHQGRVYLKVDDDSRAGFEARGSEPFRPNARQTLRTYYEVPADVLEDDAQLLAWADRAAAAAHSDLRVLHERHPVPRLRRSPESESEHPCAA